jgi:hypothetical protein
VSDGDFGMKFVAYNFGGFKTYSYKMKDEDGNKIPNIKEYYK